MTIYNSGPAAEGKLLSKVHKILGIIFFALVILNIVIGMPTKFFLEN